MSRSRRAKPKAHTQINLGSFLIAWGARLAFAVLIIVVVLSLTQCTVKKPEAPEWNTQLTVPLIHRTYSMPEIIRKIDQDGIYMDADSNVMYSFTKELDTFAVDADNLTTDPLTYAVDGQLGKITLDPPDLSPVSVNIGSISGLPGVFPAVVPPVYFDVPADFPPLSEITSASVHQGDLYLVVTNNFGVDLDAAIVTVYDNGFSALITTQTFTGGIADGETDSVLIDLGGHSISNDFSVNVECHTPGGTVNSPAGKDMDFAGRFAGNLVVNSATAAVPSLDRSYSEAVSLAETDVITNAQLANGALSLTVTNNTPLPASIDITIPDIQQAGSPLTINRTIGANSSTVVNQDLAGYEVVPADASLPQQLPVLVMVSTPGSGSSQVAITETNSFSVDVNLSSLQFSSVTGIFNNLGATIDPIIRDIDIPEGFDSLQFTNAMLTLEIENSFGIPGQLDINLDGDNGRSLDVSGAISPRVLATAATTTLVEPNVASFFAPIPSQVTISGGATFGNGASGTVRDGDYITGRVTVDAPIEVIIKQTPVETDVESEEIEQKDIDKITEHVTEARFIYNVINHLPVGATVNIVVSPDSTALYTNPELRFDDITVDAAPVVSAVVIDTLSTGYQTITLTNDDVQILRNETLYIGYELILHDSNGQPVRLTKNDFLSVIGRIEVEYRFDGEF